MADAIEARKKKTARENERNQSAAASNYFGLVAFIWDAINSRVQSERGLEESQFRSFTKSSYVELCRIFLLPYLNWTMLFISSSLQEDFSQYITYISRAFMALEGKEGKGTT